MQYLTKQKYRALLRHIPLLRTAGQRLVRRELLAAYASKSTGSTPPRVGTLLNGSTHRRARDALALALLCSAGACSTDLDTTYDEARGEAADLAASDDVGLAPEAPQAGLGPTTGLAGNTECLTVFTPPDEPSITDKAAGQTRLVFLNRLGGTYKFGTNNASTNVSSIPSAGPATLPAYEGSAADWRNLVSCVRSQYARFNVEITDVDPGAAQHIEAVVGGMPTALGLATTVGGISPFNCAVISRSIVFVFSQAYPSVRGECEAVAHEIGHSLGLEHEYLCEDPMTYLTGCGNKAFRDVPAQCGTSSAIACQCGVVTQNTVQKLLSNVGAALVSPPAPAADAPPLVTLSSPSAGGSFARGTYVNIRATVTDDRALRDVVLSWKSAAGASTYRLRSLGGTDYGLDLQLSSTGLLGARTLSVRATDDAGQTASTPSLTIQVTE